MCANHGDGVASLPFLADRKGDDGGAVTCEVVFAAGVEGGRPVFALFDFCEADFVEALDGGVDGVVS